MASKESLGRVRHLNLISQQLRLRHLRSISVRNIVPKFPLSGDRLIDHLLETYFTLHNVEGHKKAIYTSEKIKYSLNPTWVSFEPSSWKNDHSTAMNSFIVRVWGGQNEDFRLIMEWDVHLPSLHYLGDQVRAIHHGYNTVIFGLVDGYYGAPKMPTRADGNDSSESTVLLRKHAMKVDLDQVVMSYKVSSVARIKAMQKAFERAQLSVQDVRRSIENKVQSAEKCTSQLSEEEILKLKVKNLKEELLSKQRLLIKEQDEEKRALDKLRTRERNLKTKNEELGSNKSCLREHKQAHIDKRESLVRLNAQLNMRRRQLISELIYIYPITEFSNRGLKEFLLCGVRLPNCESDEFSATDEDTLSVALGYACHLLCMIAKFLELPLRYPMNSRGSRSTIMDFTIEKVADKERKFPLYNKVKEKIQFDYGVFLLNKNIAQLRQFCGLGTPNLRNTVPNLKDLLDTKFQSSEAVKSAPLSIIRRLPMRRDKRSSNSGASTESPPANPKLDDMLLKTMNASAAEGKPPTAAQPNTDKQCNLQSAEVITCRNLVDQPSICLPSEVNGDRADTTIPSAAGALHLPTQGSSHRFLEQRVKKMQKHSDESSRTKGDRTNSKFQRVVNSNSSVKQGVVKGKSSDSAENSLNDFISLDSRQHPSDFDGQTKGGASDAIGQRTLVRNELFRNPGVLVKRDSSREPNSTGRFDLGTTIDFDFPENGEIDLR